MPGEISAGNLNLLSVGNEHIKAAANIDRTKLAERALTGFPIDLLNLRVWDAVDQVLPSSGALTSGSVEGRIITVDLRWDPNSADQVDWVAPRAGRVLSIVARVEVAGTDGGAVTGVVKKAASATDIASGTALHSGSIDLKGSVDTNQTLTLSATSSALDIAAGTAIGLDFTGTLTAARGVATVTIALAASADDLMLFTGTFGTAGCRVKTGDVKAAGAVTKRARFQVLVPQLYVAGEDMQLRALCGMETTAADTTATIDFEVYRIQSDGTLTSDLVTTDPVSINSTTLANRDFTITATAISPGDVLDCRVTIAVNDAAGVAAVLGVIADLRLRCDVKP
jgi:hypothetical protein